MVKGGKRTRDLIYDPNESITEIDLCRVSTEPSEVVHIGQLTLTNQNHKFLNQRQSLIRMYAYSCKAE